MAYGRNVKTGLLQAEASPDTDLARALAECGASEEEEEDHLVCLVCKEGYRQKPMALLATYCFCKRIAAVEVPEICPPLQTSSGGAPTQGSPGTVPSPGGRGGRAGRAVGGGPAGFVYCTVSHFNLIHVACHEAAKRADASLRVPKRY